MIKKAPKVWYWLKASPKKRTAARIDTKVETPMNEAALLTPILEIAKLERKKAITEQANAW